MSWHLVAAVFVILVVGTEAFFTYLSALNLRHEERAVETEHGWIEEELDVDDPDRMLEYHRIKAGVSRLRSWVLLGGLLVVLFSGMFADVVGALRATGLSPFLQGVVFFGGALVLGTLVNAPFDFVDTFVVEEVFGFNNQSLRLWVRDLLVSTAISLAIALPLIAAVLWFIEAVPYWPAAAWALVVGFSVAMTVIKPRVIDPLFNDFTPVEGELRTAVEEVFERAGYRTDQVYEMDASRRSSHSNAYFIGFGRAKRVVLYDTLIESSDRAAIQSVLAHELAHWRKGHIWKFIGLFAARFAVVFAALGYLVGADWTYAPFAVPQLPYVGLALALLWVTPINRLTAPINNWLSLRFEREADAYAVEIVGGEPMARALADLAAENFATLFPHPWYETFHYDHPPIPERIRRVRALDGDSDGKVGPETDPAAGG